MGSRGDGVRGRARAVSHPTLLATEAIRRRMQHMPTSSSWALRLVPGLRPWWARLTYAPVVRE
eukprot:1014018-Prymnesium_polylepis.1